jgi:hypothetical protein
MTTLALLGSQIAMAIMAWQRVGIAPPLLPRAFIPPSGMPPRRWHGHDPNAPESEGL